MVGAAGDSSLRVIQSEGDQGTVLRVGKVGFLAAPEADCVGPQLAGGLLVDGRCFLPTAVIQSESVATLHRLPLSLGSWAIHCVDLVRKGRNMFPCAVEFGVLHGRALAEFQIENSRQ